MKIKSPWPPIIGLSFGLLSEVCVRELLETEMGMAGPEPALWALLFGTLAVWVVGASRRWNWVERLISFGTVFSGALIGYIYVFAQTAA
jgi:hypothetical protein